VTKTTRPNVVWVIRKAAIQCADNVALSVNILLLLIFCNLCSFSSLHSLTSRGVITDHLQILLMDIHPLTSTWPHLNSAIGLEEGEY